MDERRLLPLPPSEPRERRLAVTPIDGQQIISPCLTAYQASRGHDPAETAAKRGLKRRAKTDRTDCDLQLKLLLAGELPESWIPPTHILELWTRVRTRKTLVDQRSAWQQRLTAQLFHQASRLD